MKGRPEGLTKKKEGSKAIRAAAARPFFMPVFRHLWSLPAFSYYSLSLFKKQWKLKIISYY